MRLKSILFLSLGNVSKKKRVYLKTTIGLILAFFLCSVIFLYSQSIQEKSKNYMLDKDAQNYVSVSEPLTDLQLKNIKSDSNVLEVELYTGDYLSSGDFISFNNQTIVLGGDKNHFVNIRYVDWRSDVRLSQREFPSLKEKPLFLAGRDIQSQDEIVVSSFLMREMSVTNFQTVLGGKFSIVKKAKEGDVRIEKVIVGVQDVLPLEVWLYLPKDTSAQEAKVWLVDFTRAKDSLKKIEGIALQKDSVFYYGDSVLEQMRFMEGQRKLCDEFLVIILVITVLVVAIFIAANQYFLLKKNTIYYGILKASGARKTDLFCLLFFEMLLVGLFSEIVAVLLSYGVFVGVKSFLNTILLFQIETSLLSVFFAFLLGFAVLLALSFFVTLFIYHTVLKKPTAELLKNK